MAEWLCIWALSHDAWVWYAPPSKLFFFVHYALLYKWVPGYRMMDLSEWIIYHSVIAARLPSEVEDAFVWTGLPRELMWVLWMAMLAVYCMINNWLTGIDLRKLTQKSIITIQQNNPKCPYEGIFLVGFLGWGFKINYIRNLGQQDIYLVRGQLCSELTQSLVISDSNNFIFSAKWQAFGHGYWSIF